MVKAKSPILVKVSKGFKQLDIRARRGGFCELGLKRIPFNPKSDEQKKIRKRYGELVQKWNLLSEEEKENYNKQAEPLAISGWNLFLMQNWVIAVGLDLIAQKVLSENATDVVFDGLDINTHKIYLLVAKVLTNVTSDTDANLLVNEDLEPANYDCYIFGDTQGGLVITRENHARIISLTTNGECFCVAWVMLHPDGKVYVNDELYRHRESYYEWQKRIVVSRNTFDNVTKLTLRALVTDGFKAGSVFHLFGYKP